MPVAFVIRGNFKLNLNEGFLSGSVAKTLSVQETGFDPGSGKIPHATEQLGPRAATIELVL